MERYYFDLRNGADERDGDGVELEGLDDARAMAAKTVGELLHDRSATFWTKPELVLTVRDDHGDVLCTLTVTGTGPAGAE